MNYITNTLPESLAQPYNSILREMCRYHACGRILTYSALIGWIKSLMTTVFRSLFAGVFLKLITKYIMRCPLFSVTSTTIWMYSGKWPSYISNFFKFRLSHCTLRRGGGGCIFVQTSYNNQHFHTFFYLYGFSSMEQATCVHMLNSHPMTWNATKC